MFSLSAILFPIVSSILRCFHGYLCGLYSFGGSICKLSALLLLQYHSEFSRTAIKQRCIVFTDQIQIFLNWLYGETPILTWNPWQSTSAFQLCGLDCTVVKNFGENGSKTKSVPSLLFSLYFTEYDWVRLTSPHRLRCVRVNEQGLST